MENNFAFKRENFIIMFTGLGVLLTGFIIMMLETAEYGFGFLALVLGPIVILSGFGIQFFAIFYKKKPKSEGTIDSNYSK